MKGESVMSRSQWYVVQVSVGKELTMCDLIARVCAPCALGEKPLVEECFSPRFRTRHKFGGEWRDVEKTLMPGYIIVVTSDPVVLSSQLRRLSDFAHVLTMGGTFVPLGDEDRRWLEEFTLKGDRVVPMSVAHKEGDKVVVTSGPLKGREGLIARVNRSKCLALLEFSVGGIRITSRVGLAIVNEQ